MRLTRPLASGALVSLLAAACQSVPHEGAPSLSSRLSPMIPTGYSGGGLDVTIQVMHADSIASEFRLDWQDDCFPSAGGSWEAEPTWYAGPGTYSVRDLLPTMQESPESRIEARLTLELDAVGRILYSDLQIERIFPGAGDVILERDWEPLPAGRPGYYLVNRGPRTYVGTRSPGIFHGRIEIRAGSEWTPFDRGGACGSEQSRRALRPGTRAHSSEGVYRYVVDYASQELSIGIPAGPAHAGGHRENTYDVYELFDVFRNDKVGGTVRGPGEVRARAVYRTTGPERNVVIPATISLCREELR